MFGYFKTDRLIVRPLEDRDAHTLYEYRHLEEIMKYQSWDSYSLEKARQLIYKNQSEPFNGYFGCGNFAVEYRGKMIGDIFVAVDPQYPYRVSIGYTFHPRYHHHGFAREAVGAMVHYLMTYYEKIEVVAYVMEGNVSSMRLLISLGFELIDYDEKYGDYCFRVLKQ